MIGVVDYARRKNKRSSYNSGNAMCYDGYGLKWPSGLFEGSGFIDDDVVTVDVDRSTNTIKFSVNGVLKAS